ncbi:MAG: elongation factor Ts [Gemmatimonadales bacterium]|nr:MAG: elongation factor Ts [Gemmatimonadales bacterium]
MDTLRAAPADIQHRNEAMSNKLITAKDVAELRGRTGAGMMDCKTALQEADGDMEKATEILRRKGIARADKRSDRSASQGMVVIETAPGGKDAAMIELNCETDFVAKNEDFIALAKDLARHALAQAPVGAHPGTAIEGQAFRGGTVGEAVKEVSGKTGEAMSLKRVARFTRPAGMVASYLHFTGQVGVLIDLEGPASDALTAVSRDLGLHIASMDPIAVDESGIDPEVVARERRIAEEQVAAEGKPENIRGKIVAGKVKKFVSERTLLGQPFVKDDKKAVADIVQDAAKAAGGPVTVKSFARFKVGEN